MLFNNLVRPKLEFGSIIWGDQPQMYLENIEKVQNKYFLLHFLYYKKYNRWPDYGTIRITRLQEELEVISITG